MEKTMKTRKKTGKIMQMGLLIIILTTVLCLSGCSAKEQKEQNGVCRNLITAVSFVQRWKEQMKMLRKKCWHLQSIF